MKRSISLLLAVLMCATVLFTALPVEAMEMDFVSENSGRKNISLSLLMEIADEDMDDLVNATLWLKGLTQAEIEAQIAMPKPGIYVTDATDEEREAYAQEEYQTRKRLNREIDEAFVAKCPTDMEVVRYLVESPGVRVRVKKSELAELAAMKEVIWVNDGTTIYIQRKKSAREKIADSLWEAMENAPDDECIPIRLWLRGERGEEVEAMNPLSYPGLASTREEIDAYITAAQQASGALYVDPYGTFVQNHLDENDELLYPGSTHVPVIIAKVPKAKVTALANLQMVSQVDPATYFDGVEPIPSEDPAVLNKIDSSLLEIMSISSDDDIIPIWIYPKDPPQAEIDALITLPEPPDGATLEEVNAYIAAKRAAQRQVYSAITAAFVENYLDESDEVFLRSVYTTSIIAGVPKAKIAVLAALDEVRELSWAIGYDDPAYAADSGEVVYISEEEEPAEPFRFEDVMDPEDYYYDAVYWAVDKGITKGTSDKLFSPEKACTRAEVVTFLWRAAGSPEPAAEENPFADVSADSYYGKAVLWAVENGITEGTGEGKFSPDAVCTRAQIVTFLWRSEGEPDFTFDGYDFADVKPDDYYYKAVQWAVEQGITKGTSTEAFSPDNICTRAQVVTFLSRAAAEK